MFIKAYHEYIVVCRGVDKRIYRWYLKVEPEYKAWRVSGENIQVGDVFKGYYILSIEDATQENSNNDLEYWSKHISKDEFDWALNSSSIEFAASPSYSQAFRCQICGGVVINDICTDCMFDWDS